MGNTSKWNLKCTVHPFGSLGDYKFVVVCSRYNGKWLLSMHDDRDTWETQGGHIEAGEDVVQAARRELLEESGVNEAELIPVCDYYGYTDTDSANGAVFLADVKEIGKLPNNEMQAVGLFPLIPIPSDLTYPKVTPVLIYEALNKCIELGIK